MKTRLALLVAFVLVLGLFASMQFATRNSANVLAQAGPVGDPSPCNPACGVRKAPVPAPVKPAKTLQR